VILEYVGTSPTIVTRQNYGLDVAAKQQITEAADRSAKKPRNFIDVFGNGVKTILGFGAAEATTTTFQVSVLGQRTRVTDPRSLNTTYVYDTRGLLTSRTSPDAGTAASKYDFGRNLRFAQDAKQAAAGQVAFTGYDFANRPLTSGVGTATFSALDPNAAPGTLETTNTNWLVVRAYDAKPSTAAFPWSRFSTQITPLTLTNVAGRLAAVASKSNNAWQVTLFSYDTDGRVAKRWIYTEANGGASVLTNLNTSVTYTRDLRDALTQRVQTTGASSWYQWQDYDSRGLLWKVFGSTTSTKPGTADVTYTYRPSGEIATRLFSGGSSVPLTYTIREQLDKIGDPATTTYPFSARYTYNPNSTISEAEFYSAGSPATQKRYRYQFPTYDALNRLKSADHSSWSGSAWTTTLAYDLANINYDASGNLTGLQRYKETAAPIDNLTYTVAGTSNRLTSIADAVGVTTENWDAEAGSFTYDANGNVLTTPGPWSVTASTYDPRNLPLSLTIAGTTTNYRYDDGGQRITKQVGAGNTEVYLREGAVTLGVFTVNSGGTVTSSYFNLLAGDRVVGRQPSTGSRSYYHTDLLGSTRAVLQGATVVESYDFDPWGLLMPGRTLGSGTKERFTSKERDGESQLDYFGARYYLAALGRWGQVDPAPFADRMPEWSPYSYVKNEPSRSVDANGECPICIAAAAVIVGSAVGLAAHQVYENYRAGNDLTTGVAEATLAGARSGATSVLVGLGIEVAAAGVVAAAGGTLAARTVSRAATTGEGVVGAESRVAASAARRGGRVEKVGPTEGAGPHSGFKRDPQSGRVTGYTEFDAAGNPVKRFRGEGKPHGGVDPPLVLEPKPGKGPGSPPNRARPARPDEIPGGGK
jgi:RHS repeat-associated protein